jgi:peptidoglycan/LPS O-acetylase OafA/YrhL
VTSVPRAVAFVGLSVALGAISNSLLPHLFTDLTGRELAFFSYYWFPANLQSFAFGCLAYHLLGFVPILSARRGAASVIAAVGLALTLIVAWSGVPWILTVTAPWSRAVLASLASLALAVALASHSPRWLVNPVTRFVGRVSYSAYLVHFLIYAPALAWIGPVHTGPVQSMAAFAGALVAVMAASVALSDMTYRLIENPGIRAGNGLIARLSRPIGSEADSGGRRHPATI